MSVSMTGRKGSKNSSIYKRRKIFLAVIICAVVVLITLLGYGIKTLTYDKVYNGVYINNVDVSGLTKDELIQRIPEIFDKRLSKSITLKIDNIEHAFESLVLVPALDTEKISDEAFKYGRTQKLLGRFQEINSLKKNPQNVPFIISLDDSQLQKVVDEATKSLDVTAIPNKIDYGTDCLIITKGQAGNGVLFREVKSAVTDCILNDKDVAYVDFKYIEPEEITYDYVMRYVVTTPVEASYTIENHRIKYTESKPGVSLDKGKLENALKNITSDIVEVPAKITQPKMTSEMLKSTILADELGKYSTDYSSSSNDRAYNIKLACEKINGYVLNPGEEFSYNDVVGPRTVERGFRIANVYVGNTVQPGIGGGICQVSSTMYNSVIFADLEITERRNHTLPVTYVPKGRDATVSYGATDFRFKNTTSHPIEIRAIAEGGINTVIILGTDEHPQREIKIETTQTGTSSPKVIIEKDSNLPLGEIKVESAGTTGSSHVSYKVVYENGKQVSRTHLANSTYRGKDRVEIHGTKEPEVAPEGETTPNIEPTNPQVTPDIPQTGTEETQENPTV